MARRAAAPVYRFDRFVLDFGRGTLVVDGVECALRHKSLTLLKYLVENLNASSIATRSCRQFGPGFL
jgi:hypothetical protein